MSLPQGPTAVLPFCGLLFRSDLISQQELQDFLASYLYEGTIAEVPGEYSLVDYYQREMGPSLKRLWYFGLAPNGRNQLVEQKLRANSLEQELMAKLRLKGRCVNIDPGFIALEQVVLATGKPYSHRVYLNKGIYAELTYQFQQGKWVSFPWTYPDYLQGVVKMAFQEQRNLLKAHLK